MNHDYAHCLDYAKDCPKECFRAELQRDIEENRSEFVGVPLTYAHLRGKEECELAKDTDVPDKKVGKWIPVSEGLPKKNGRYLVTRGLDACGALWNRVYIINYSDLMGLKSERIWWDGSVGKSDFEHITDVVAWMPLPKPWKGENG